MPIDPILVEITQKIKKADSRTAQKLFEEAKERTTLDPPVYTALMFAYARDKDKKVGLSLIRRKIEREDEKRTT